MTTDNKHKWECISPGEYDTTYKCSACGALFTDQADDPNSLIPEFGCTVTTDLSNRSVTELLSIVHSATHYAESSIAAGEIARRLEEAQQKIVAQQEVLQEIIDIGSGNRPEVDEDCAEGRMWRIALDFSDGKDFTALTANNAKVAAEAKAKVREDLLNLLHEAVGFCGHCGKKTCAGRESNSILPGEIDLNVVLDAIAEAAEYRAKIKT